MASTNTSVIHESHPQIVGEICPLCDQPIPADKLVEIQQRERERAEAQTKKLREDLTKEKTIAIAAKQSELDLFRKDAAVAADRAKQESEKREAAARAAAKKEAETAMTTKLAAAEQDKAAAEKQLKVTIVEKEQAQVESKRREAAAREEAKKKAEAAMSAKLTAAVEGKNTLEEQLKALKADREREKNDSEKREAAAREAAKKEAESRMAAKVVGAEKAKKLAEEKLASQTADHQKALQKERELLDSVNQAALAQKDADHFREREKNKKTLDQLRRQLERKTADERGEGAEIDLHANLREAFDDDQIKRIGKAETGADIWHDVKHNGEVCGRIVYDSKNHGRWSTSFTKKLRDDQLAAEADHAVLVLAPPAFPSGARQLDIRDGIIVANPARVVTIVSILREHIIQTHRLRLSEQERDEKMVTLYDFINSDRCNQLFAQFDLFMKELDDLEVTEKKAHEKTWVKRGQLMKKVLKVIQGQLRVEIDKIVETGSTE